MERMISIRAFVGIDFDSDCKRNISDIQQRLRTYAVRGRWKHCDNFHLTLKFLNEINAKQQKQIDEKLMEVSRNFPSFRLETSEPGIFNGKDSIRVLWLGLAGDLSPLQTLALEIDRSLAPYGFKPESRSYTPHITLGQDIVFEYPFDQIREAVKYEKFGPFVVKELNLFKSEQIQNKRIYTRISQYPLAHGENAKP